MFSSYTAAVFARKHELAARHGVNLEGALTWAFTFEDQPLFAGFRQLASGGIALPVLGAFRMMAKMDGERIKTVSSAGVSLDDVMKDGVRSAPDVSAMVSVGKKKATALVWHYHDDDLPGPGAEVSLTLENLPTKSRAAKLTHWRIDETHSNAFTAWQKMGSPMNPTRAQYAALEAASQLARLSAAPPEVEIAAGKATVSFTLPRRGVSLIELTWR